MGLKLQTMLGNDGDRLTEMRNPSRKEVGCRPFLCPVTQVRRYRWPLKDVNRPIRSMVWKWSVGAAVARLDSLIREAGARPPLYVSSHYWP